MSFDFDDLLNSFDNTVKPTSFEDTTNTDTEREAGESRFHLNLNKWDASQGPRMLEQVHGAKELDVEADDLSEFFNAAFAIKPTKGDGACVDQQRAEFLDNLLAGSDFQELHHSTHSNPVASEMAAIQFARAYAEQKTEDDVVDGDACRLAAKVAKVAAQAEQDEMMAVGLAAGLFESTEDSKINMEELRDTFMQVKRNPMLRSIMERAGAMRRVARSKQRTKTQHGMDEVVGVKMDGDAARLLPSEMAKLAIPELEMDVMRRLVERQTLCRDMRSVEDQGRGPVCVVVDESTSMTSKNAIEKAKAFALTMAWVARHQKRQCILVSFAAGAKHKVCILNPKKWDQKKLMEWLASFMRGGTSDHVLLGEVPLHWNKWCDHPGKTELIVVTDGRFALDHYRKRKFLEWKETNQVKMTGLFLENGRPTPGQHEIAPLCDKYAKIKDIDKEQETITECFGLN